MAKTALITGASQGLGACMAKTLAADGFNIAINCLGERERETAAIRSLKPAGRWVWKQSASSATSPTLPPAKPWQKR